MDGRTVPTGARSEALEGTHEAAESKRGIASKIRVRYSIPRANRNRLAQPVEATRRRDRERGPGPRHGPSTHYDESVRVFPRYMPYTSTAGTLYQKLAIRFNGIAHGKEYRIL